MQRADRRTYPRQATARQRNIWPAVEANAYPKSVRNRAYPAAHGANRSSPRATEAVVEFGRFRVLSRHRQLLADGVPVDLGTRAFDLLLALLAADGSLVSKEQLLSEVWQGIVVSEENLKVQVAAVRKALGADRELIRTEFGRGYRFTAEVRSTAVWNACPGSTRQKHPSGAQPFHQWSCRRSLQGWPASDIADRRSGSRRHG
jgi:DNA-binding winged helix-turn-helix (wHTH) protein